MFRLMRNIHLIFGLLFFFYALLFAVSSLFIIYRRWLPEIREDRESLVPVAPEKALTPRTLALELMQRHGLKGDLGNIKQKNKEIHFTISRPGTESNITYVEGSGEVKVRTRRQGFLQTLANLHVNHGFWHDFLPANAWALSSFLGSIGLLLLGASGIYLWFYHHEERLIGSAILAIGLAYSLTVLVLTRVAG
jgi:hypothetical protein